MSDDNNPSPPKSRTTLAVNLLAGVILAVSVTMLTDFSRRLLSSDPDTLGVISILFQAVLAVGASSSFTSEGWSLLPRVFERFQKTAPAKAGLRITLSTLLLIFVAAIWYYLPPYLAEYYNARGYNLPATQPAAAVRDFRRAIALDPTQPYAFYNLGEELETAYQYSDAATQYQIAITTNPGDANFRNNLARVLLLDGKSLTALQITSDALALPSIPLNTQSALHKNRAQAEYDLGFYPAALADAARSDTTSSYCILAKTYAKLNRPADAAKAWTTFEQRLKATPSTAPQTQPDCLLLAEEQHEKP